MAEKCFDLNKVAEELGVECMGEAQTAMGVMKRYEWKHSEVSAAAEAAKKAVAEGEELYFMGGAMPWLLGAVIAQLAPLLTGFNMGSEVKEVFTLPMGEASEAGKVKFGVEEKDGKVYIAYECDDPSKPFDNGPHNYNLDKLKYVVLPELKPGTHLYLKTQSYFYILSIFIKSWISSCDSINIWDMMTNSYVCAWAKDESLIGKEES